MIDAEDKILAGSSTRNSEIVNCDSNFSPNWAKLKFSFPPENLDLAAFRTCDLR